MKAVNLIPADQRKRGTSISTGVPFLALVGGLVIVLIAVAMFVLAHNRVESRKSQLASVQARTAQWSGAAGTYTEDLATNKQRQATIQSIETLVGQRANWSEVLGQLAGVMPAHSQLQSLTASASSSATPSTGSTATTGSTASASGTSSIQITGCAASQTVVAETMIAFRRISGVSAVSLGQSSRSASGSGSGAGCAVSFSLTLAFTPPTFAAAGTVEAPASDSPTTSSPGGSQ